ncbi:hypothetical protein [Dyadobacter sp. 32]|uniref:hypothetical protein n=1 Tax=Dyadobacter sp. 32 TaxID=538966 RepID=UPI0039C66235
MRFRMDSYVAVITADMVNSTHFSSEKAAMWLRNLTDELRRNPTFEWRLKPEIYRGDSFQGVLKTPEAALRLAILSRAIMRKNAAGADVRIAIGIGTTDLLTDRPGTSDGEAFRLSGRLADQMRERKSKIAFALPQPTPTLDAMTDLLETLIDGWTTAQCEVIRSLIQNENISQIAERLSISQSAVSQRVSSAKWWAIESALATYPSHLALYIQP